MNTIFSDFSKDVDLSIFRESNKDPKTPLRRHYLSLVGLLEYVDILNGGLPGRSLPEGMTVDDVKRMVSHAINDLDTKEAMSTDSSLPEHDYVDLGLPSGTLWATENIKDAEGKDLYFAWGETRGYTKEQVEKYGWYKILRQEWKKYNKNDGLMVLEPEDDAATVNWGKEWKTPTKNQFVELMAETNYEWTEIDGVPGAKLTSKVEGYTDKFIFFPAVGLANKGAIGGPNDIASFWTNSLIENALIAANRLYIDIDNPMEITSGSRYYGASVRPVLAQCADGELLEHDYVDLGLPSGTLWATENIKDTEGNNLYFAWGETHGYTAEQVGIEEGKRQFIQDDYELNGYVWHGAYTYNMNKYNETDGLTVLELEDDAAMVNWGEEWKIPTKEQFEELIANTTCAFDFISKKFKFTSIVDGYTDKFISLPGVGYVWSDGSIHYSFLSCRYWSASLNDSDHKYACNLSADLGKPELMSNFHVRSEGLLICPVRTQGIDRTQGTQGTQGTEGTQGTQGTEGA